VQLLFEHGATAVMDNRLSMRCSLRNGCCCTGLTALMSATTVDIVKVLLTAGADVHMRTDQGDTCLHLAVQHELPVPVVCLLIKAGVDLHAVNYEGKTAAQLAHDKDILIEQLLNRAAQQQRH
jgi:ankyrin repeat protein